MRALLLGLILVNVLYWTWSGTGDATTVKVVRALDPDLPLLELIPRAPVTALDVTEIEPLLVSRIGSDDVVSVDDPDLADDLSAAADAQTPAESDAVPSATPEASLPPTVPATIDAVADVAEVAPTPETPLVEQNLLATADPVANPARCVGVGPFTSLRVASEAAALLNQAGLTTAQRVEESQVWVGHWVHLPSYPTREAAIQVVERLRKEGVKDIYIEPSGELKNTISLGLFTELERAEIRAGNVRKLGDISPQIRNRSRDGLVYWIDVPLDAGVQLDTTSLPQNSTQELKIEPVDCPPLSAKG